MLSVYVDGDLMEDIRLFDIDTLDDLHKMMLEKGFELMPDEEFAAMKKSKWAEVLAKRENMHKDAKERRAAWAIERAAASQEETTVEESPEGEL